MESLLTKRTLRHVHLRSIAHNNKTNAVRYHTPTPQLTVLPCELVVYFKLRTHVLPEKGGTERRVGSGK